MCGTPLSPPPDVPAGERAGLCVSTCGALPAGA